MAGSRAVRRRAQSGTSTARPRRSPEWSLSIASSAPDSGNCSVSTVKPPRAPGPRPPPVPAASPRRAARSSPGRERAGLADGQLPAAAPHDGQLSSRAQDAGRELQGWTGCPRSPARRPPRCRRRAGAGPPPCVAPGACRSAHRTRRPGRVPLPPRTSTARTYADVVARRIRTARCPSPPTPRTTALAPSPSAGRTPATAWYSR